MTHYCFTQGSQKQYTFENRIVLHKEAISGTQRYFLAQIHCDYLFASSARRFQVHDDTFQRCSIKSLKKQFNNLFKEALQETPTEASQATF